MELWTAFTLGLVGSLHCAGMCGPLALALPPAGNSALGYFGGRVAYNLGRILTYGTIGLGVGLIGKSLLQAGVGVQRWVSISLGVLLITGLLASRKFALARPATLFVGQLKASMGSLLKKRSFLAIGVLGLLNGLLPCGLVYVAAATAATTAGGLTEGAEYMVAFGIGTVPMMLTISLSGKLVPVAFRLKLQKAIPVSIFLVGALLILRGMSLGIPYISPDLTAGGACCH